MSNDEMTNTFVVCSMAISNICISANTNEQYFPLLLILRSFELCISSIIVVDWPNSLIYTALHCLYVCAKQSTSSNKPKHSFEIDRPFVVTWAKKKKINKQQTKKKYRILSIWKYIFHRSFFFFPWRINNIEIPLKIFYEYNHILCVFYMDFDI